MDAPAERLFDVRTHPKASLLTVAEANRQLEKNEREKKRQYCARINTIDRGVFTPLVFSTHGTVGRECAQVLKALADLMVKHKDLWYLAVMEHL